MAAPEEVHMFNSYGDAEMFISQFEEETSTAFVKCHTRNHGMDRLSSLAHHRIWWEDLRGAIPIACDGIPFVSVQSEVRQCHQGKARKKDEQEQNGDHLYHSSRKRIQPTKRIGCPAHIRMKMVVLFPEYEIDKASTEWRRRSQSRKLRDGFCGETIQQFRVFVTIDNTHQGHMVNEFSGYGLPLGAEVKQKISSLVDDGITSPGEIGRLIERESHCVSPTNRRFLPTLGDIRNHVSQAVKRKCFSQDDQQNLLALVTLWKETSPEDNFFYRPVAVDVNDHGSFLFVQQSAFQKDLMQRYGQEMVLLDSTYNTTKYDVPLFLLCVSTNVGYTAVSTFIVHRETVEAISEALQVIVNWNKEWKPTSFMCDFDKSEISALERTFQGAEVFLCDFHREQAWQRWFSKAENKSGGHGESVLKQLRKIADSDTEIEYEDEVTVLRSSELFLESALFRNWIEKHWLQEKKRWVYCFRSGITNIQVSTTNGVEAQNKKLKYQYLQKFRSGSSLSGLVKVLVEKYLPESRNLYIRNNIVSMSLFKRYSTEIPSFLHDRPKKFITHCLKRIANAHEVRRESIVLSDGVFQVQPVSTSGQVYRVCLTTEIPSCTCADWKKFHWPCKHMFAIFHHFPENDWNTLSRYYKSLPYFNLDNNIVHTVIASNNEATTTNTPVPIECDQAEGNIMNEGPMKCCEEHDELVDGTTTEKKVVQGQSVENNEKAIAKVMRNHRYKCLSVLKTIQSGLFCVSDLTALHEVYDLLHKTDEVLYKNIPKIRGLPLRSAVKRNRRRHRNAKKNNKVRLVKQKNVLEKFQKIIPLDGCVSVDETANVDPEECHVEQPEETFFKESSSVGDITDETELIVPTEKTTLHVDQIEEANPSENSSVGDITDETEQIVPPESERTTLYVDQTEEAYPSKCSSVGDITDETELIVPQESERTTLHVDQTEEANPSRSSSVKDITDETELIVPQESERTTLHVDQTEEANSSETVPVDKPIVFDIPFMNKEHLSCLEVVDQIWKSPDSSAGSSENPVGKVGQYILTCQSIRNLKTRLSDEVLDAYFHLLTQSCSGNNLHINCVVMTSIFKGTEEIHSLLRTENIYGYDHVIGAVNEDNCHWTLMVICPNERKLIYMNPLGEKNKTEQQLLQRWYAFLHQRWLAKLDNLAPTVWSIECPRHSKQRDGLSCGVYVLKLAESYLAGRSLHFKWNRKDVCEARRCIAAHLLYAAEPQVEPEEVKADVFPEIIEPELKIPKYPSRERKPKETDIEYSRPPYNPVENFVPEEYRGHVSQGVLKSALVNSHRDEVLLRQRERVETVFVKTFTDIPYKLKGLALPASEIDPNVFNLLCDWDNLEEKLA